MVPCRGHDAVRVSEGPPGLWPAVPVRGQERAAVLRAAESQPLQGLHPQESRRSMDAEDGPDVGERGQHRPGDVREQGRQSCGGWLAEGHQSDGSGAGRAVPAQNRKGRVVHRSSDGLDEGCEYTRSCFVNILHCDGVLLGTQ